jgi:ATP-dependent DNA helicase RecG
MVSPLKAGDRAQRLAAFAEPVTGARFVDVPRAALLAKLGISTIGDLIGHVPFRYLDLSDTATLANVRVGTEATVVGTVHEIKVKKPKPRLNITEVAIVDGTGVLIGVWFNQPWVQQRFVVGERVAFAGKVDHDFGLKQIRAPFVEKLGAGDSAQSLGRILPVHRSTDGLSTGWLRRLIAAAVDDYADVPDHLPAALRLEQGFVSLGTALREIHFPGDASSAREARRRLAFDELLSVQLYMAMRRYAVTQEQAGIAHAVDGPALAQVPQALPFALTAEQQAAVADILGDMAEPRPMNRMLLGDVGTGKTAVAAHALAAAADSGGQAAMMAPTEVLAQQYAEKVGPLLDACGVGWTLLTGSVSPAERRERLASVADGSVAVVFGTHALLEEAVAFKRLTLAVVDEQHRFGVNQRLGLRGKGASADLLVMTATPIPRSLALTLYGDLATSYLRERPVRGAGVETHLLKPHQSHKAHDAVRSAVKAGRQAYVVCALVEESTTAQAKAATLEVERLRTQVFHDLRVGLLTGKMRPAEKAETMARFRAGEIDVLVSTTVIEVGVDVPNATQMIIENAERFGLAQLHQLRGRVGRGADSGEVWLVSDAMTKEARERLDALVATTDGFALAERDLELRGEGHVLGDRQHGMPDLRVASLIGDLDLVEAARRAAFAIVAADPHLERAEHGPLRDEVRRVFDAAWEWVSAG